MQVALDEAIELIEAKREADRKKLIKEFSEEEDLRLLNGRWGPYISYKKANYKIPKDTDAETLTYEQVKELIENAPEPKKRGKAATKTTTKAKAAPKATKKAPTKKKAPAKKTAAKKK